MSSKESNNKLKPVDIIKTIDITKEYIGAKDSVQICRLMKLEVNGKCMFDDFLNLNPKKVNKKREIIEELDTILTLLIQGEAIPPNKMHPIGSNEFEIRIKRTRVYFFYDHPYQNIVVLGHYNKKKDDQQEYINKFRQLKLKYQHQKNEQI